MDINILYVIKQQTINLTYLGTVASQSPTWPLIGAGWDCENGFWLG